MVTKVFVVFAFLASVVYTWHVVDEKPFDCPPNEEYYQCSLAACWKTCDHLLAPPPCPQIAANCYMPSCECIDKYLRNKEGKCIPIHDCPRPPV